MEERKGTDCIATEESQEQNASLEYEISGYSSYSGSYKPENILVEEERDQGSRWSSDSTHPPQFLLLRLRRPAILRHIRFGKFEKSHVCNLKRFRVYGGLNKNALIQLLESGLKNDSTPEVFQLKYTVNEI